MTSLDHVFKELCDFHGGRFSNKLSCYLVKFGDHRPSGSRDITGLVFHVTLQDHVIRGPCDFMDRSSSLYIPTLLSLVTINIVVVDIN